MKYFRMDGIDQIDLPDGTGIGIQLDDGSTIQLYYRKSDGKVDLMVSGGILLIEPKAANCAYIRVEKRG